MNRLYYSSAEKILFYIPSNYTHGTGTLNVLKRNIEEAELIVRCYQPISDIYCYEIPQSTRYKGMWVFYTTLDKCPKDAFELNESWTMDKWIKN